MGGHGTACLSCCSALGACPILRCSLSPQVTRAQGHHGTQGNQTDTCQAKHHLGLLNQRENLLFASPARCQSSVSETGKSTL